MTVLAVADTTMAAEMAEQPAVLQRLVAARDEVHDAVRRVVPAHLRGVALVGRGSSENALVFARYALEIATRRPVTFVAPSVHALYGVDVDYGDHLAIAASQSGRTPEVVDAIARLGASAATIALTADVDSPLARAAHAVIDIRTGVERAIPATKTFTAQVAVAAMAAEATGPVAWRVDDWRAVPDAVADVVADVGTASRVATRLGNVQRMVSIARGFLLAVAREAALKLQETALLTVASHSAASFRHGPIAAVAQDAPVVAVAAPGPAGDDVHRVIATLRRRGVPVVTIGPMPDADLPVPPGLPEALVVFPAAARIQQLALALAVQRGIDPDAPPGLEKVMPT